MFNCHIHTFNASDTPDEFFKARVEKLPAWVIRMIGNVVNTKFSHYILWKLMKIPSANLNKILSFLYIGTMRAQDEIFESAAQAYPAGTRITALSLNFHYMGGGKLNIPYVQQLDTLLDVRRRYPDTCLPFVCIDPRMGTADENLQLAAQYIRRGCVGIKLYPSLGFYPFDRRLEKVYRFAEKEKIPLMVHCSRGGIHYYGKDVPSEFLNPDAFKLPEPFVCDPYNGDWKDFKNNFLKPVNWEPVMSSFPDLKVCLAHFGFDANKKETLWQSAKNPWFIDINRLVEKYENFYTDVSYTLYDDDIMKNIIFPLLKSDGKIADRILFGTDYYMTIQESNVTENGLYTKTLKLLGQDLFNRIACKNCKEYMNSTVWNFN